MKVGVVQTAGSLYSKDGEIPAVLQDCIKSVKTWSKYNGYEHCLVPQPTTHYELCRHPDFNRGFRKYEVCAQVADQFDYIIYLDINLCSRKISKRYRERRSTPITCMFGRGVCCISSHNLKGYLWNKV